MTLWLEIKTSTQKHSDTHPKFVTQLIAFILSVFVFFFLCAVLFGLPLSNTHMKQQYTHTALTDFPTAQQQLNLWQEIDGGKYQISCVRGHCTPVSFSRSFSNTTKMVYHMFSANDSLSSQFKKTISFRSGNGFTHSENAPSSCFHHLFIRALHIRCHLIWCCSVAGEQGQLSGARV